ncbi:MAG: Hsp20/alpha crystallin family protein, partial [Acidobacteria bacterium]|nr:Hsp20/alpha crystallin family protein [Acidobacteriota bacterium]
MVPFIEVRDLADDVRRLFEELDRANTGCRAPAGEWTPPLDFCESRDMFEIRIDLPGVSADAIRVLLKKNVVLIAGEKVPTDPEVAQGGTFQLVERNFGRFARAVRLQDAVDARGARATLASG